MIVTALKMCEVPFCRLFPPQAASNENREKGPISLALERAGIGHLPECLRLIGCQPVAQTNAKAFRTLDSANSGSQVWAQQAGISGLVCKPPYGC